MTRAPAAPTRPSWTTALPHLLVWALIAVATVAQAPARAATGSPLDAGDWHLVAHMSDRGGMSDGDTQLAPDGAHGTFVADPDASTPDFQRAFPVDAEEILFITGDGTVWATTSYPALRALIDARSGAFAANLAFERSIDGVRATVTGNVLSRQGPLEDPWISIADGGHVDGTGQGLIVWGENDWGSHDLSVGHVQLKNTRGGLDVYVRNPAPRIGAVTAPLEPVEVGTPVHVDATFADDSRTDTHVCSIDHGDGTTAGGAVGGTTCATTHTYTEAGVYDVAVTVTDAAGNSDTASATVVVYDPSAGFVTGGGWVESPAGALVSDPTASGRASFGFVSRYRKGADVPEGRTLFRFRAGDLAFTSDSYQWLVVAGDRAQFKGTGTVNGVGEHSFLLTAVDGDTDSFRIRITLGDTTVYDNHAGGGTTDLGGGSIVIHR